MALFSRSAASIPTAAPDRLKGSPDLCNCFRHPFSAFAYPCFFQITERMAAIPFGPRDVVAICTARWRRRPWTGSVGGRLYLFLETCLGTGEGLPLFATRFQLDRSIGAFAAGRLPHALCGWRYGSPAASSRFLVVFVLSGHFGIARRRSPGRSSQLVPPLRDDPRAHPQIMHRDLEFPLTTIAATERTLPGPAGILPVTSRLCCGWIALNWLPSFFGSRFNSIKKSTPAFAVRLFSGVVGDTSRTYPGHVSTRRRTGWRARSRVVVVRLSQVLPASCCRSCVRSTTIAICLSCISSLPKSVVAPIRATSMDIAMFGQPLLRNSGLALAASFRLSFGCRRSV